MLKFNSYVKDLIIKDLTDNGYSLICSGSNDKLHVYVICKNKNFNNIIGLFSEITNTITFESTSEYDEIKNIVSKYNIDNIKIERYISCTDIPTKISINAVISDNKKFVFNTDITSEDINNSNITYEVFPDIGGIRISKQTHLKYLPIDGIDQMFSELIVLLYDKFINHV